MVLGLNPCRSVVLSCLKNCQLGGEAEVFAPADHTPGSWPVRSGVVSLPGFGWPLGSQQTRASTLPSNVGPIRRGKPAQARRQLMRDGTTRATAIPR